MTTIDSIGRVYRSAPGRKKSKLSLDEKLMSFVVESDGHWLWTGTITTVGSYPQLWHEGKTWRAHRLSLIVFVGPPPSPEYQADHKYHVKLCIRPHPEHVIWATPQENTRNYHPEGRFHNKGRRIGYSGYNTGEGQYHK